MEFRFAENTRHDQPAAVRYTSSEIPSLPLRHSSVFPADCLARRFRRRNILPHEFKIHAKLLSAFNFVSAANAKPENKMNAQENNVAGRGRKTIRVGGWLLK